MNNIDTLPSGNMKRGTREDNGCIKLLLDCTDGILLMLDREANILNCSGSFAELLGIGDVDLLIGKPLRDLKGLFGDQAFWERGKQRYQRLLTGESGFTEEDFIEWPNIGRRLYHITHKLVERIDYGFQAIVLILRDVTQEYMEEDDRRILLRLQASHMPCMVWDEKGGIFNYNAEALAFFGYPEDLPPDQFEYKATQPEYQPDGMLSEVKRQRFIDFTLSNGYAQIEVILTRIDGTPLPAEVVGVRVSWQTGYRLFIYLRDLTEVKEKEAEAKEAEERIKVMLDGTPLICILRNEKNEVIDCNQEALNRFGVSDKMDFIRNFQSFYPEYQPDGRRSNDKAGELIQALFNKGILRFEWLFQKANGEHLPVETTFVKLSWKGARHFLSYSRDLSEEKNNEQIMRESILQARELELQKEKAQAASEAKNQFFASMSHEIRTPMNTIIGLLELMRTDNMDQEQFVYINEIKRMSAVLLQIINDILDFQKIEAGKLDLLPVHFDLFKFFNHLISRHKFLAESKHLMFTSKFSRDMPRLIFGDELRLGQIIANLLTNAIKYTRDGYVSFSMDSAMRNGKEYLVITVEDSGIGIKEEHLLHLFDDFEQFDSLKNRNVSGTGLGLSISKRLAAMMDGSIDVISEYGKGSTFTFSMPFIQGDIGKLETPEEIDRVIAKQGTKVLVVDDNDGNIIVARGLLARHGIYPETAVNGMQAVDMIRDTRFDLVLMDHMMPEMDGVEATQTVRKMGGPYYGDLPIIALTANAIDSAKTLFRDNGMNDFISKPINVNELNRVLLKWLPEGKIGEYSLADANRRLPEDENAPSAVLEELMKIPDLSLINGLSQVAGDKKLYIEILRYFCRSAENDAIELKRLMDCGDWKDYTIKIHALKSVFTSIGNQFMAGWAYNLESASRQGNIEKCLHETPNFCLTMQQFYLDLRQTGIMDDLPQYTQKRKINPKELNTKLMKLLNACNDFNADATEALTKELMAVTLNPGIDCKLQTLFEPVQSFDYSKAVGIIEELMQAV